jgi:hypothetical protein
MEIQIDIKRYHNVQQSTHVFLNTSASANFPPAIRQNVSLTQEKCLVLQPSANGRESCVIKSKFWITNCAVESDQKRKSIIILLVDPHSAG